MINVFHNSRLVPQRFLSIPLMLGITCAQAETWVGTDQAHPVTNTAERQAIVLDEQQRLKEHLTSKLPPDPTQAGATIQASPEGIRFQRELTQAQQGATEAWRLGVEKIPAVVVDRRYVVYGEADVGKAIALIDRARSAQQ